MWRGIVSAGAICLAAVTAQSAQLTLVDSDFLSNNLPIRIGTSVPNSDSVFINGTLSVRGVDYTLNSAGGVLTFANGRVGPSDTVRIVWQPLSKLRGAFVGKEIFDERIASGTNLSQSTVVAPSHMAKRQEGGSLAIRGAKSFRMSGGSTGVESTFGQTLDLSISGKLSRSVDIQGTISDRPDVGGYGTLNSRINEIDRLRLVLTSPQLRMEVGDFSQGRRSSYQTTSRRLSGLSTSYAQNGWLVAGTAARSKGEYQSSRITIRDGIQGPYRISGRNVTQAIVPQSETVWLDGRKLERGPAKDYTIDYPAGTISFSPTLAVDSRSRVEIDYEGVQATYRKNVLGGSFGWGRPDSSLYGSIDVTDERDDQNDFLFGELDDVTRLALERVGDSAAGVRRSTIREDSLGAFVLVADSLPDTVLQFVGKGNGDLTAQFSYIGERGGRYAYSGNGDYRFVGFGLGEYEPVALVAPARGLSLLSSVVGGRWKAPGAIRVVAQQSRADNNLYSSINDEDNLGHFVELSQSRTWGEGNRAGSVDFRTQYRERRFRTADRRLNADEAYLAMLPVSFDTLADQFQGSGRARLPVGRGVALLSEFSATSAKGYFDSRRIKGGPEWHASPRLMFAYSIEELATTGKGGRGIPDADGKVHTLVSEWLVRDSLRVGLYGLSEHRVVTLNDTVRGANVSQWKLSLSGYSSRLSVERTVVDTLAAIWSRERTRWRVSGDTRRGIGNLDYAAAISWQRIADTSGVHESVGLQTSLDYRDSRRKMHATYEATIADEERQERGLAWLDVGDGLGGYRYENGEYVADPFGQFIQTEEVLSGRARVRRIERSSRLSRNWSQVSLSANARITEERITGQVWSPRWLAPFLTDPTAPRQFLDRSYDLLLRAFPVKGVFVVNLQGVDSRQSRRIGGSPRNRGDRRISMTLKQPFGDYLAEEEGERFDAFKDSWYSGGDAKGYRLATTLRRSINKSEVACAVRYRHATGDNAVSSSLVTLAPSAQIRKQSIGDLRCEIELYTQDLSGKAILHSLTDGHDGRRGVHWMLEANAAVTKTLRFTARLQGRHADNARARIQARSELVASF